MSIQHIVQLMERLIRNHAELLDMTQRKKQVLIDNKIDELTKIVSQEIKLVRAISETEEEWRQAVVRFMEAKGYPAGESITLSHLIKAVSRSEDKLALREAQHKLQTQIDQLKQANGLNQQLIDQSLAFVNYSLDMMTGFPEDFSTYQRPEASQTKGNRRGVFDTRA